MGGRRPVQLLHRLRARQDRRALIARRSERLDGLGSRKTTETHDASDVRKDSRGFSRSIGPPGPNVTLPRRARVEVPIDPTDREDSRDRLARAPTKTRNAV